MVQLEHPNLPGRVIDVREEAVRHHERAGWRRRNTMPQPEPEPAEEAEPDDDAEFLTDPAVENAETAVLNLGLTETR